jgi:hypothetical protein
VRKQIYSSLFIIIFYNFNAQHIISTGAGVGGIGYQFYTNYQYHYKFINTKTKLSVNPFKSTLTDYILIDDYYFGVKTKEGKKNIFCVNIGASFIYPQAKKIGKDYSKYYEIKKQIVPILNFNYSYSFNSHHSIIVDLDIYQYSHLNFHYHNSTPYEKTTTFNLEIGYGYRINKNKKL